MFVRKVIEKNIKCCQECPYYDEYREMGATIPYCSLIGDDDLDKCTLINGRVIFDKCPIKNDSKVVMPTTQEELKRDMNIAYQHVIEKCIDVVRSVSGSSYRDVDGDWVEASCNTKDLINELKKLKEKNNEVN